MPKKRSTDDLPAEVESAVAELRNALRSLIDQADEEQAREAASAAFQDAWWEAFMAAEGRRKAPATPAREEVKLSTGIARNLRHWRVELAGWTQEQLAEAARKAGLRWNRVTVAEIESEARQVSLDELLVLASLYSVPVVELLFLGTNDDYRFPNGQVVPGGVVNELIAGPEYRNDQWDYYESAERPYWTSGWYPASRAARAVSGPSDWRPARGIHDRLQQMEPREGERFKEEWDRRMWFRLADRPQQERMKQQILERERQSAPSEKSIEEETS